MSDDTNSNVNETHPPASTATYCHVPVVQAVLDFMSSHSGSADQFGYMSSNIYWAGAYLLADLLVTEGNWGGTCVCGGGGCQLGRGG
jgi:hypothetical protein